MHSSKGEGVISLSPFSDSTSPLSSQRHALLQSYWGAEAISEQEAPTMQGGWQEERLRFDLQPGRKASGSYRLGIQLDPVGDLESFFELGWHSMGEPFSAVYRRARSGYKRDAAWTCDGATWSRELGSITLPASAVALRPLRSGASFELPEGWRINAFYAPEGGRTLFLTRPPNFSFLRFCLVDKVASF